MVGIKNPGKIVRIKEKKSSALTTELKQLSAQIESKKSELDELGKQATKAHKTIESVKKMENDSKELEDKIGVLESKKKELEFSIKEDKILLLDLGERVEASERDSLLDGKIQKSLESHSKELKELEDSISKLSKEKVILKGGLEHNQVILTDLRLTIKDFEEKREEYERLSVESLSLIESNRNLEKKSVSLENEIGRAEQKLSEIKTSTIELESMNDKLEIDVESHSKNRGDLVKELKSLDIEKQKIKSEIYAEKEKLKVAEKENEVESQKIQSERSKHQKVLDDIRKEITKNGRSIKDQKLKDVLKTYG